MLKLIEMLRIGICPIGSLIMQESGLNLRGLVPGARVDWNRKEGNGLERNGFERTNSKGLGLKRILLWRI